jgi:hypothetical protein
MSNKVINERTEENIKNYLAEGDVENSEQSGGADFGGEDNKNIFKNKKAILGAVFLVLVVALALFYFMRDQGKQSFDQTKVKISIEAPNDIASGEDVVFDIKYENNANVNLTNARISLFIPEEFIFISSDKEVKEEEAVLTWNLGNITSGSSMNIKLFGKIIGELDQEYYFDLKISYTPENFNYEFESNNENSSAIVKIASVPFELFVQSPAQIINGDAVEYVIDYKNTSNHSFRYVNINLELPDEFIYESADTEPSKKEEKFLSWSIENLASNAGGKFILKGKIQAIEQGEKEMKISINASENDERTFEYIKKRAIVKVEEIPVIIRQLINGAEEYFAEKGEELEYTIKFKNISESELRGLVINSSLEGKVDFDSIQVDNGSYDKKTNKIIWSGFNVPKLASFASEEEGEVSFKVKIKDYIEIKKPNEKNFIIKNTVIVSSFNSDSESDNIEKIIASNESNVKLGASLFVKAKGFFNDDGRIKNEGEIPPAVGKKTEYLIHWNLSSLFNDLNNTRIISILPEGVDWTGNYITSDGKISLGENEKNGAFAPISVDVGTIDDWNEGVGEEKLTIDYNWYDNTARNNGKERSLPENLSLGDTLEFAYDDGAIKEIGYCAIKEHPTYKEHGHYCSVPWKITLPSYDRRENYVIKKVMPEMKEERFYYNSDSREVIWEMPKLEANTGNVSPVKEVVFQINIIPKSSDVGKVLTIMGELKASGYDEFVGKEINAFDSELTTELPDDDSIGIKEGVVVEGEEKN